MKISTVLFLTSIIIINGCNSKSDKELLNEYFQEDKPIVRADADTINRTIVSPYIQAPIDSINNLIYCISFQLAWNDLKKFEQSNKTYICNDSNKFISKDYCFSMAGLYNQMTEKILEERLKIFSDSPNLDFDLNNNDLFAISYLQKTLLYEKEFDRSEGAQMRFKNENNVYFFYSYYLLKEDRNNIYVDKNNPNDFIIKLKAQNSTDEIILAKIKPKKTLFETYSYVIKRIENSNSKIPDSTYIQIPYVKFHLIKNYDELNSVKIKVNGTDQNLANATQMIDFDMNENGIKIESIANISFDEFEDTGLSFDKPFIIILREKNAKLPYFAAWINNTELMRK